jgi:glycosyltransferase involved in cell wall biosynthesis
LRANVIHADLNPCGGAEQLALATLQSLCGMGMQVDLTVARRPDTARLEKAFGKERIREIFGRIGVRSLGRIPVDLDWHTGLLTLRQDAGDMQGYDVIINTHADILPYYLASFSGRTFVTYCHYPVAADYARQRNTDYLNFLVDLGLMDRRAVDASAAEGFWHSLLEYYLLMLRNSAVVTNSEFSRKAIVQLMKSGGLQQPAVIAPPVSIGEFQKSGLFPPKRSDTVLVVSRINRSKKLENAILLARILKRQKIGKKMVIAGNLSPDDYSGCRYYNSLLELADECGVSDYVTFRLNCELKKLGSLMQKSKVYFHPLPEEPFGISVVEAMSAGLIPVVPDAGGQTEFVPARYQFHSLEEAAGIIRASMQAPETERLLMGGLVRGFSSSEYIRRFQNFIGEIIAGQAAQNPALAPQAKTQRPADALPG